MNTLASYLRFCLLAVVGLALLSVNNFGKVDIDADARNVLHEMGAKASDMKSAEPQNMRAVTLSFLPSTCKHGAAVEMRNGLEPTHVHEPARREDAAILVISRKISTHLN